MHPEHHPIAVLHEQTLIRQGLVRLINELGNYTVVADAATPPAFKRACASGPTPQAVVLSVEAATANGYAQLTWLVTHLPTARILVVGTPPPPTEQLVLFLAGAHGFLCTRQATERLRLVLDHLLAGALHFPPEVLPHLRALRPALSYLNAVQDATKTHRISDRQREFLRWVASKGSPTYQQIAGYMGIKLRTVEKYRDILFERFDLNGKPGLVLLAVRLGLVE